MKAASSSNDYIVTTHFVHITYPNNVARGTYDVLESPNGNKL